MRKRAVMFILAVFLLIPGVAGATTIGSIGGGYLDIGDKRFDMFSITVAEPFAVSISSGWDAVNGVAFITFNGPFSDDSTTAGATDYLLRYRVQTLGGQLISEIDQSVTAGGVGSVLITEVVRYGGFAAPNPMVGRSTLNVVDTNDPPGESTQSDQIIIVDDYANYPNLIPTPRSMLYVNKDILLNGTDQFGIAATEITQSFHQTQVPEPATLLLFGLGLVGLAGVGRKFKK